MIYLGNLSVHDIERRLKIEFSIDDKKTLAESHQDKVNDTPIADNAWHCFDIPLIIVCGTMDMAIKVRDIIGKYKFEGQIQIGWERNTNV